MTLATLILSSLAAGFALITAGWVLDALHARSRRHAGRSRPLDRLAGWDSRVAVAPHFAAGERSAWPR